MDRVFLDANVLFSAAYKPGSRLTALWARANTLLLSSAYAIEEARRNLSRARPSQLADLERLIAQLRLVPESNANVVPLVEANLVEKDRPIDPLKFVTLDAPGLTDDEPVNKRWGRNSAIGMVLGLLLGCMLAIRRPSSSSPNQDTEPA